MPNEQVLVPLRITVGRKVQNSSQNGKPEVVFSYPDFDARIDGALRGGMPWTNFQDLHGGAHYDHLSPVGSADDYNPDHYTQFMVITVPPAFAEAAVEKFPDTVQVMTEEEFTHFYEARAHAHEPRRHISTEALNALRAVYGQPSGPLVPDGTWDPEDVKALDPDDPMPGICMNKRKKAGQWLATRSCKLCKATIAKHRGTKAAE